MTQITNPAIATKALAGEKFTDDEMTVELRTEVAAWLSAYTGDFSFVVDIRNKALAGKKPSIGQIRGVANCMVAEVKRNLAALPTTTEAAGYDYAPIVALLTAAKDKGLLFPRLTLQDATGADLIIRLKGAKSKHPGAADLLGPSVYGERVWYGRIEADGTLVRGGKLNANVIQVLDDLAANPVAVAKSYGHLTSNCCFCGKFIETKESMAVGYGPVCAANYGLPWGEVELEGVA